MHMLRDRRTKSILIFCLSNIFITRYAMIIDFHTHTFPDKVAARALSLLRKKSHTESFTDGTDAGLSASQKAAGIDLSLLLPVATYGEQATKINAFTIAHQEERKALGLLSFGAMHPDTPDYRNELIRLKEAGIKGIKLHPVYQGVDFDDDRYVNILNICGELGLAVIIHAGWDIGFPGISHASTQTVYHAMEKAEMLSGRNPVTLILAHMGGWREWEDVCTYFKDTPVFLDTSFSEHHLYPLADGYWDERDIHLLSEDQFLHMVDVFGAHRILFATDSPWSDQTAALRRFRNLPLKEREQTMILGENAGKILGLGV